MDGGEEIAGVVHGVGGGLFDIGVAAGLDGLDAVVRVLEVGGGDEDGVDVVAGVECVVVDDGIDGIAGELLDEGRAFFTAQLPDVGDGDDLEVQFLGGGWKAGMSPPLMRSPQPTMPTLTRSLAPTILL